MLLDEDKIDDWSDTGILGEKYNSHTITSDMIHLHSWQTFLKLGYVGLVKWSLPCSVAPFYDKNFSPYLKVFLPLNISVKKHRPPHGGEAIFQVVWIFHKEDGHTAVLCGTLLCRGNKSNSRAVRAGHLLFRVYKLVYNLISWHSSPHLPLFYWTTYMSLAGWGALLWSNGKCSDNCLE